MNKGKMKLIEEFEKMSKSKYFYIPNAETGFNYRFDLYHDFLHLSLWLKRDVIFGIDLYYKFFEVYGEMIVKFDFECTFHNFEVKRTRFTKVINFVKEYFSSKRYIVNQSNMHLINKIYAEDTESVLKKIAKINITED